MRTKLFPKTLKDKNPKTVKMEATECGWLGSEEDGIEVIAATDAAGSQVVVESKKKKGKRIHLISRPLKNHQAAVELGNLIVEKETTDVYKEWYDLTGENGTANSLFAIFGGHFR
jgi:hypothetical protein